MKEISPDMSRGEFWERKTVLAVKVPFCYYLTDEILH